MEVSVTTTDQVTVFVIRGSVDGLTAERLLAVMDEHVNGGATHLVADFSGLEYTSSAGLRALLSTVKRARSLGGDLRLAAVRPQVLRVLDLSGFTSILKLYDDVPGALASYA